MVDAARVFMYSLFGLAVLKLVFNVDVPVGSWWMQGQAYFQDLGVWTDQTQSSPSLENSTPISPSNPNSLKSNPESNQNAIEEAARNGK